MDQDCENFDHSTQGRSRMGIHSRSRGRKVLYSARLCDHCQHYGENGGEGHYRVESRHRIPDDIKDEYRNDR
jgi:type II secretory ATPase GspE/PulE/Tfp pilus assembly ATPase PilB-like protein